MSRVMRLTVIGLAAIVAGPGKSADAKGPVEDDLAVVRRAVAVLPQATTPEPSEAPATRRARKNEPQWLRVSIKDKDGKAKVAVNVPLALARALGASIPLEGSCHLKGGDGRAKLRVGDILEALDSGQDIVQIDGDDGRVRVWVE